MKTGKFKLLNFGFTLIELMAVIVILGILSVVIIPKIGDSISSSKNRAYQVQVESIRKGVNDYLVENGNILSDGGTITLTLGAVKQGGYLPVEIKNPLTKKNFSNESNINISMNDGRYDIELNLFDVSNYNSTLNPNSPIIALNGNYIEYVDVYSNYIEKGAVASDYNGNSIAVSSPQYFLGDVSKSSIDTSILGSYSAVYSVSDSSGNRSSATRTIIVRDNEAPIINVPSNTKISISQFSSFDPKSDLLVSDNYDGIISNSDVVVTSNLANRAGTYVINYKAIDSSGNESTFRRVVIVDDSFDKYYTRLEYIESTGTQYIDTGVIGNQNTGFDIVFYSNNSLNTSKFGSIFGSRKTSTVNELQLSTYSISGYKGIIRFGANTSGTSGGLKEFEIQSISLHNRIYTNASGATQELSSTNFETPVNLTVFALNENGNMIQYGKLKLYSFKLYDGNNMIRNFVPCYRKADGVIGLYDSVNDVFYTNSGTGEFIKGEL